MPNRPHRERPESTDHIPSDRHHGGRELPDELQDRPEQNAVYDSIVHGERVADEEDEDVDLTELDKLLESDDAFIDEEPLDEEDLPH